MALRFQHLFDDSYTVANTNAALSLSKKVNYFKYSWLLPIALVAKDVRGGLYDDYSTSSKQRRRSSRRSKRRSTKTEKRRQRLPALEEEKKEEYTSYTQEESKEEYTRPIIASIDIHMAAPAKSSFFYGLRKVHGTVPTQEESKEEAFVA